MRLFYLFYENGVFIWDLVILYESLSWNTSSSSISGILSDNFFWFYHCCVIIYFVLFSLSSLLLLFLFFIAVTCYLSSSVSSISYFRSLLFSHFLLTISHHFLWFCSCFSILISCIFVVFIHSSSFFYNMFGFICSFLYVFLCCRRWCFRYDHFYMIFLVRYFKWCVFGLFTVTRYFFLYFALVLFLVYLCSNLTQIYIEKFSCFVLVLKLQPSSEDVSPFRCQMSENFSL